jgi:hypothetical protein
MRIRSEFDHLALYLALCLVRLEARGPAVIAWICSLVSTGVAAALKILPGVLRLIILCDAIPAAMS